MVYFIQRKSIVSSPCGYNDAILDNVRKLNCQRDMEKIHQYPEALPTIDSKDWPKTLEAVVEEYIHGFHRVDNVPHNYILREKIKPKAAGDDPVVAEAGSGYFAYDEEIFSCVMIIESTAVGTYEQLERNGPYIAYYVRDRTSYWQSSIHFNRGYIARP